jgi:uncharacterized protein YggE
MNRLFTCLAVLVSVGFIPLSGFAEVSVQGPPDETAAYLLRQESRVTLSGSASTVVDASMMKASITFTNEAVSSSAAAEAHQEQRKQLLDRLQAIGIPRGEVKVPKFITITPRYSTSQTAVSSYSASSTMTLELSEQKQYVDLVGLIERTKGAQMGEVEYDHAQLVNLRQATLALACKRVTDRKQTYEQSLGVTLKLISFTEEEAPNRNEAASTRFGQIAIKAAIKVVYEVVPGAPAPVEAKKAAAPAPPGDTPTPR